MTDNTPDALDELLRKFRAGANAEIEQDIAEAKTALLAWAEGLVPAKLPSMRNELNPKTDSARIGYIGGWNAAIKEMKGRLK